MTAPDASPAKGGETSDRRALVLCALCCAAAAGFVLFAASRGWVTTTVQRPAPMPAVQLVRTGAALAPWLPALALVALAGAGALFATRGLPRTVVGLVLLLCGSALAVGAVIAAADGATVLWPVGCALAGVVVATAGAQTVRCGRSWPSLGTRYERHPGTGRVAVTDAQVWDALDRGVDPTSVDPTR